MRTLLLFLAATGLTSSAVLKESKQDICLTPECAVAAASIIKAMDVEAEPCEDFYQFACGGWMDSNVIPDGKNKWGRFYEARDKVDAALKAIVTDTEDSVSAAVNDLKKMYRACMDTEAIEKFGLDQMIMDVGPDAPQGGWPMVLDSWDETKFDAAFALGAYRNKLGINVLLSISVYLDDFDTEHNVISVDQPSLGLPMSMYLDPEKYSDYITAYKTFMVDTARVIVREVGSGVTEDQLAKSAEEVFAFESSVAEIMTPESERRNSTAMYNPMTLAQLKEKFAKMDWDTYMSAVFDETDITIGDDERVIVVQPDFFENAMLLDVNPETVANYIYWRTMMVFDRDLTKEMRDIAFKFKSAMDGVSEETARWQICTTKSVDAFGFAAAHEYVKANFDEEAKVTADDMVHYLKKAFKELVSEVDWMDEDTQKKAMTKADQMLQLIGYPDWLRDPAEVDKHYSTVPTIQPDLHLWNVVKMTQWSEIQQLGKLRETPRRDEWHGHPAIVNAWYSPNENSITFPAGILQPPFFGSGWPRYLDYGAMGMVIGHEITHGFDDQGRQYDGTGSIAPWWSEETIAAFVEKAQCFVDQYGNYTVPELVPILGPEGAHLDGKRTQGENIADNGGIRESFRAYQGYVEAEGREPALPGLTQFTAEQLFFISNAQVWCEIQTPESLLAQVLGNPHSPGKFRVIGPIGNSEDFQTAFSCPADSPMNREDKCKLW